MNTDKISQLKLESHSQEERVNLSSLESLTGFPKEFIANELFNGELPEEDISLQSLREAMVRYIDTTMLH